MKSAELEVALLKEINRRVRELCRNRDGVTLMEVCGTHTMAISSSGIRRAVDPGLKLVSGPGCPVCVTDERDIDRATGFASFKNVVVVTFGDMMRVPGTDGSLAEAKAKGAEVRVVYSPLDGLQMAIKEPEKEFVFLGVGFETTAPTVAATVLEAKKRKVKNFSVLPLFKLIPPALEFIASSPMIRVDGLILPGHVSTVIGAEPYRFLVERYRIPCCITGFEPADVLEGIWLLLQQITEGPQLAIQYRRSVRREGNPRAQALLRTVFKRVDANWRGLGRIAGSGLGFKKRFVRYDASSRFEFVETKAKKRTACQCGEVMLGVKTPPQCRLFGTVCTPQSPVGPCMVSSEGACAAYYRYER
ncbi:MAG: hydrogenase formation protein HypD [bacterium]